MRQTRWTGSISDRSSAGGSADLEIEEDTEAVIEAYTAAVTGSERSRAFEAALRAYRRRHPDVLEPVARRRVAQALCFADTKSAG
jgi:hypothetical protein